MTKLFELSVTEAAAQIARRQLSPVALTTALLDRIDEVEPRLQAWETVDREGALAAAHQRERELSQTDGTIGPLHGVPVGVKDIFFTAGLRTTAGFPPYADFVPAEDAAAIAQLRKAGAIILGKTVTTQFAYADTPRTKNPWRPDRTPGGSSSGSGAAVAARMVPAALGSQTAGSVLRPAAYCGCVGLKPTFGRISRHGVFPLSWSLDHVGVLTRTVPDAALLFRSMAGFDPRDPDSASRPVPDPLLPETLKNRSPRLGLVLDFLERAQPEVRSHLSGVAQSLRDEGAAVVELRLPVELPLILAVHHVIMQVEAATVHAKSLATHSGSYGPRLRSYVEIGQLIPGTAYVHARRLRQHLRKKVEALLEGFDCLLLPTASNVAPDPETTGDRSFQAPWSLFGFPSISLPTGLGDERLPFAAQLVAAPFCEDSLLQAAAWCESVIGPLPSPL